MICSRIIAFWWAFQAAAGLQLQRSPVLALRVRVAATPIARRGEALRSAAAEVSAGVTPSDAASAAKLPVGTPPKKRTLVVRIDDKWVDLTGWRNAHPAGAHWIDAYHGLDATEVMHAFHSDRAMAILSRLPEAKEEHVPQPGTPGCPPDVTPMTRSFRRFRASLKQEGWFERSLPVEAAQMLSWAACLGLGIKLARGGFAGVSWAQGPAAQLLAVLPLAIANSYAGWLAHDYVHGTDKFCGRLRHFGAFAAGLGTTMWSDKHNLHHAKTNEVGVDTDLPGGPVLFIWPPTPGQDRPWRKLQHLYLPFAYSLLFVVWRLDSLKVAWKRRLAPELVGMGLHYAWALSALPPVTFLLAVLLSGLMSATIVTVSHQTEDLMFEHEHDWVKNQFDSTRDVFTSNPFSEWLWGGMQYQLLHHLFPDMPRYKYPALRPRVAAFAAEHNIEYRTMGEWPLLWRNIQLYRDVANAAADPEARVSTGGETI